MVCAELCTCSTFLENFAGKCSAVLDSCHWKVVPRGRCYNHRRWYRDHADGLIRPAPSVLHFAEARTILHFQIFSANPHSACPHQDYHLRTHDPTTHVLRPTPQRTPQKCTCITLLSPAATVRSSQHIQPTCSCQNSAPVHAPFRKDASTNGTWEPKCVASLKQGTRYQGPQRREAGRPPSVPLQGERRCDGHPACLVHHLLHDLLLKRFTS
jgi:hypothetical protein